MPCREVLPLDTENLCIERDNLGAREIRMLVDEPLRCSVNPLVGGLLENRNAPLFT